MSSDVLSLVSCLLLLLLLLMLVCLLAATPLCIPMCIYTYLTLTLHFTLLHFASLVCRERVSAEQMKRPFMDHFLETMYQSYDIGIWSQTVSEWVSGRE